MKTIGIIGFGQMGQFMAKQFMKDHNVIVWDPFDKEKEATNIGVAFDTLENVAKQEIIFLFPPISKMNECCEALKEHIKPNSILIEGCSVMMEPIKHMLAILPKHCEIVGCHPLFGPQSGKHSIKGFTLVLSNVRCIHFEKVKKLFEPLQLKILEMNPEEHDRLMAKTQALEQFIGRILIDMNIKKEKITTPGFDTLVKFKEIIKEDSEELFECIQKHNPFAAEIRKDIIKHVQTIGGRFP